MKIIFTLLVITFQLLPQELSYKYFKENIKVENLKANLEFLASDELEGREATFRGEKITALFLAAELQKYGVKPLFDNSYLQEFPVEEISLDSNYILELWDNNTLKNKFRYLLDFLPSRYYSATIDTSSKIFFAGFGITTPEHSYDSYKDINVGGNVVFVLDGVPEEISKTDSKKYSFYQYKIDNAIKHGAIGMISISDERITKYWDRVAKNIKKPGYSLIEANNTHSNNPLFIELALHRNKIPYLFNKSEEYDKFINSLKVESHELPGTIKIKIKKSSQLKKSYNVIGVIDGNDPALKNEFITICAHYDHIGIVNGKIHNGADDNASGTVAVLEIARMLSEFKQNKRSILLAFHGGEEKGSYLGSDYFTRDSLLMKKIVSLINLDMIGREHEDTIYSVGTSSANPEYKQLIEEVNASTVNITFNYSLDNPNNPAHLLERGDHYNYSTKGIPFVFFYDFMLSDYHQETDDIEKINYNKIKKVVELTGNLVLKLANLDYSIK